MYQVSFFGNRAEVERVSTAIDAVESPPAVDLREYKRGHWVIDIFEDDRLKAGAYAGIIELLLPDRSAIIKKLPETDWVARSYENLPPVRAGRFVIAGGHVKPKVRTGRIPILIEAGAAFGTGHHGTTLGCLKALELVMRTSRPKRVLDIGTGTGVLAIASLLCGCKFARGSDLSSDSILIATENARKNCVGTQFKAYQAHGIDTAQIRRFAPYDLVFANILAKPLIYLAPSIREVTATNGIIVLSGLLNFQESIVVSAFASQGYKVLSRLRLQEWSTLLLKKI